jgi:Hemerythrin HHE cation binding domain
MRFAVSTLQLCAITTLRRRFAVDSPEPETTIMKQDADVMDAIELLKQDHRDVEDLFARFEETEEGSEESMALLHEITIALSAHARVEEEIFYPAVRDELGEDVKALLDEAAVEHASLKKILVELSTSTETDYFFRAKVKVLSEYVKHHMKEEEEELMPMIEEAGVDTIAIGAELMRRKEALMAAYLDPVDEEDER